MTHTDTADPAADFDLPEDWTENAKDLFAEVLDLRPDLAGPEVGSLFHACSLTSAADRLDEVARAANMTTLGSTGQVVVHPAVVESRLARTASAQILARLVPAPSLASRMTASERARSAARARWSARTDGPK